MSPLVSSSSATSFSLIVDGHVKQHPNAEFANLAPFTATRERGARLKTRKVSWANLHDAIIRAAHILNPLTPTGELTRSGRVIALLAVTDNLIYQTLNLAIIRSGNIALPISHRNSAAAVANLLRKTDCHDVLLGRGSAVSSLLAEAQAELIAAPSGYVVNVIELPSAELLYPHLGAGSGVDGKDSISVPAYPIPADVDNLDAIRFYIHSSGTTSLPKPIPIDERYLRYMGTSPWIVDQADSKLHGAMASPPFHIMGIILQIMVPLYTGAKILLWDLTVEGHSVPVPSPENVIETLRAFGCNSTLVVPTFLVAWAQNEEAVEYLRQMDYVLFGGGPLPDEVGDSLVARGVNVISGYGGTEFAGATLLRRNLRSEKEWAWLEFAPTFPLRWLEHSDGKQVLYELQVLVSDLLRPSVLNTQTPDGPAYGTSDLFIAHPTKQGLFKIIGRLDDQVTLATGEKVNPNPIELALCDNPIVHGAVLVGRARNQVGVIIEIAEGFEIDPEDDEAVASFRNMIWPTVEVANSQSAGFARIFKETIIPSVSNKPFPRTPKGSVQRKRTTELYEAEIEHMYAAVEKAKGGDDVPLPDSWAQADVEPWLASLVQDLVQHPIKPGNDLFEQGADSLTATFLRNRVVGAMKRSPDTLISSKSQDVDPNVVFSHPTVSSLAAYITTLASHSESDIQDPMEEHLQDMNLLLQRYTADLPITHLSPITVRAANESVVITGTTGALGSLMLARAIQDERIERVWAINRGSRGGQTIAKRQRTSFIDKALDPSLLKSKKLRFVEAELSADHLGLDESLYNEIRDTTTLIIHNAWRLDFNLSIKSFESHIKGTRRLVDLALSSPKASAIRFLFTSSVGIFPGWPDMFVMAPEEPIVDPRISVGNGYGESKYVTEKVLEAVNAQTGLATTTIRVGQLSGNENGFWSSTDWVPILLASSVQLGCLPDARGIVSWIPLNSAASSVLDVGLAGDAATQRVVHLYHPRPVPWTSVMTAAAEALAPITGKKPLPLVPFSEWFKTLEACGPDDMKRIPALKLLSFYRPLAAGDSALRDLDEHEAVDREALGFVKLATDKMQGLSSTMRNMPQLTSEDPARWISYWSSKGLFPSSA